MKQSAILFVLLSTLAAATLRAGLTPGTTYRLQSVGAGSRSLFVKDASTATNADVVLWPETDVPAQQWTLTAVGNTAFALRNVYTGLFLGLSGTGRGATTRQIASMASARWRIEEVDGAEGIYRLKASSGNNYLTATATADGTMPELAALADGDNQLWRLIETEPKEAFDATLREEAMDRFISAFVTTHNSYRAFGSGGWGNAEMLEVGLDAYEATGLQKYLTLCRSDYQWFNQNVGGSWDHLLWTDAYKWFGHDFNDDVMWQIIAVARLAWITGESQYLNAARKNFDIIYDRAYMPQWGMMRWAEDSGDDNGTNSCIMGPTEVAACYLAMAGAGEEYFEKARALYEKQRQYLADMRTGQVYDSFVWDPATGGVARNEKGEERFNRWASTYNQGTMLGAAVLLYDHYGTPQYAADADKIMEYTVNRMCTSDGIISVCQVNDGDLCGFKGILMRYARRYVLDLNRPQYQEWLSKNAFRAYNNRDTRGVTTSAWLTKSKREETTSSFSCSCAASAAVNTVLGQVEKDALTPLPATAFDYQGGVYVLTADDATPVLSLKDNTWVAYDNMRFGDTPAHSIAIGVGRYPYTGTATVSIYLDEMAGEPIATIPLTQDNADSYVFADIKPTTGTHHVYLRFAYSTRTRINAFQLAQLQFSIQSASELADGIHEIEGQYVPFSASPRFVCNESSTFNLPSSISYDLSGRRLKRLPHKGLFIKGGKLRNAAR